jgi:hypothetical protein
MSNAKTLFLRETWKGDDVRILTTPSSLMSLSDCFVAWLISTTVCTLHYSTILGQEAVDARMIGLEEPPHSGFVSVSPFPPPIKPENQPVGFMLLYISS